MNRILLYRYGGHNGRESENTEQDEDAELSHSVMEFDLQLQQW